MRLLQLDLTRYGRFTEHSIDFGNLEPDVPDLHIIYGPNEAGKSTAMAAFLDLLFGIELRSRYNFLHAYPAMSIGARLELGGTVHHLQRLKRSQNSLLDMRGQSANEGLIQAHLGGIDRDSYRMMFSLDDETLEVGGNNILASKGDLGQLLFSASTGLADLSRSLAEFKSQTETFYKKKSRTDELTLLKASLAKLKEERERIDTLASQYAKLLTERDTAHNEYTAALSQRSALQARLDQVKRLLNALPRLNALRQLQDKLDPLKGLPRLPSGWAEEIRGLEAADASMTALYEDLRDQIASVTSEIKGLHVDGTAVALAKRVADAAGVRDRFTGAKKDLPNRYLELHDAETKIRDILLRLEQSVEDPKELILSAKTEGDLRRLIEAHSGIDAKLQSARSELEKAKHQLDDALKKSNSALGGKDGLAEMEFVLSPVAARIREAEYASRKQAAKRYRDQKADELSISLAELSPWKGEPGVLPELPVPDNTSIENWKMALAGATKQVEAHKANSERLRETLTSIIAEIESFGSVSGIMSDAEAGHVRAERENAWSRHREKLDTVTADAFESALRQDDLVTARRFAQAQEVARLNQLLRERNVREAELSQAEASLAVAQGKLDLVKAEIGHAAGRLDLELFIDADPARFQSWLSRRNDAIKKSGMLRQSERDLREIEEDAEAARQNLAEALKRFGYPLDDNTSIETILSIADALVKRSLEAKILREAAFKGQGELEKRTAELESAVEADKNWRLEWSKTCRGCWLGASDNIPNSMQVRNTLPLLVELAGDNEKRLGLSDRIKKMEADQAEFAGLVRSFAQDLGMDRVFDDVALSFDEVQRHVGKALDEQTKQAEKKDALSKLDDRCRDVADKLHAHNKRKEEMITYFGVTSLIEVSNTIAQIIERDRLTAQANDTVAEIVAIVRAKTFGEAIAELEPADKSALEHELQELAGRRDDQNKICEEWFSRYKQAEAAVVAVGGDDAVARIEEQKQTILAEVNDKAQQYLRHRIGSVAAEQALRVYRDRHRGSMMARASDAFRTISRGVYTKLTTQPDGDSESLVAVSAQGGSKTVTELSKGTRFQLYLALRVAGYLEFVQTGRAVPFIADDIMETFDDFRAEEAMCLLADMAKAGQVIYFTHHRHLLDITRRICPSAKIHHLSLEPPSHLSRVVNGSALQ